MIARATITSLLFFVGALLVSAQPTTDTASLLRVQVGQKFGFSDKTGKIIIPATFSGAYEFSEGLALVWWNCVRPGECESGFIDSSGKLAISLTADLAWSFSDGLARVGFGTYGLHGTGDHKTGYIDKTGKLVIPATFRDAAPFYEGLALVYDDNGNYGFIDKTGKVVVPLKYDYAGSFSEGLAGVFLDGKYGFIDKSGNIAIRPQFTAASDFLHGSACVKIGGTVINPNPWTPNIGGGSPVYALIDKSGKTLKTPSADDCMQSKFIDRPWLN